MGLSEFKPFYGKWNVIVTKFKFESTSTLFPNSLFYPLNVFPLNANDGYFEQIRTTHTQTILFFSNHITHQVIQHISLPNFEKCFHDFLSDH